MLKDWQFNVLFVVGVFGALFLLLGPTFGLTLSDDPLAYGGIGAILTYVLTQAQRSHYKSDQKTDHQPPKEDGDGPS